MKDRNVKRFLTALLLLSLVACNHTKTGEKVENDGPKSPTKQSQIEEKEKKVLMDEVQVQGRPMVAPMVASSPQLMQEFSRQSKRSYVSGKTVAVAEGRFRPPERNSESYNPLSENRFIASSNDALSTFSIDVDTASYANVRRFISSGQLPPVGAVRIEEMINYFDYDYPQPKKGPFSLTTELGPAPWNQKHQLLRIGLKAREIDRDKLPPANLVFLIDISGSMNHPKKLPLLKKSMNMLVDQLGERDRVSIVVYAGSDRVVLAPTSGKEKKKIREAILNLQSGGSTHASSGILTAYKLAEQTLMPQGNNRIILASDGDFNVGVSSRDELQRLIEEKRKSAIYLTVLGYGMGNYHDDTMEILADKGNGNYAYIDSLLEAKKVLVKEMSGTLFALARDVKIQVEFNPARVAAYRLIGYENRNLADEDFNDDKKDAGEIGVGHTVTALYELIPTGASDILSVDPLKYQQLTGSDSHHGELLTVKLRYKSLSTDKSTLVEKAVISQQVTLADTSVDFRFAASVAGFGMLLQKSEYLEGMGYKELFDLAKNAKGDDRQGYRAEFIRLLELSEMI